MKVVYFWKPDFAIGNEVESLNLVGVFNKPHALEGVEGWCALGFGWNGGQRQLSDRHAGGRWAAGIRRSWSKMVDQELVARHLQPIQLAISEVKQCIVALLCQLS